MNYMVFISGILAALATIGHFVIGAKAYLQPMQKSNIDIIPKGIMICLFHYASVWLIISTIALLQAGLSGMTCPSLVQFIAFVYLGMCIVQIIIAVRLPLNRGIFKLFQWVFWISIALFALIGSSVAL